MPMLLTHDSTQSSRHSALLLSVVAALLLHGTFMERNADAFQLPPSTFQLGGKLFVGFNDNNNSHNQNRIHKKIHHNFILTSSSQLYASSEGDNHHEMSLKQDGTGIGGGGPVSITTPKRIKKHKNRKKKMRAKGKMTSAMKNIPLTKDELAMHVSSQYVTGPGSLFKQIDARRNREAASLLSRKSDENHKEHVEYLRNLDKHPTLVLNADYQPLSVLPLSIWSWQDTVKGLFSGKVTVVDVYPGITIRAVNMEVPLPSVIALNEYVAQPNKRPAFTRRNVFLRDGYSCQYCQKRYRTDDLSLDHVYPRCNGGKLEWENAVTCCKKCNSRKGSTLPNRLRSIGMRLIREPRVPTKYDLAAQAGKMVPKRVHPTWQPFLGIETNSNDMEEMNGAKDTRNYFELE